MTILEYAFKFMQLSLFSPTYVGNEMLKINRLEVRFNPGIKEKMSVRHYTSYEDMHDTVVNVERATKEKNKFYNKQRGMKRSGDQRGKHGYLQPCKRPRENLSSQHHSDNRQRFDTRLMGVCNACAR